MLRICDLKYSVGTTTIVSLRRQLRNRKLARNCQQLVEKRQKAVFQSERPDSDRHGLQGIDPLEFQEVGPGIFSGVIWSAVWTKVHYNDNIAYMGLLLRHRHWLRF